MNPARSYEEALVRVCAFMALDDCSILPQARTTLLDRGARTPLSVVLLHGLTNHPGQYCALAPLVFERGANVFMPRLPEHGDKNRMTRRLAGLTARALLASATESVDIACGLGERVCVLGISSSGVLGAYFAQHRPDVARAVCVSPVFGMLQMPYWLSRALTLAALTLPNAFLWWDPRVKEQQRPATAYPRFPTRALAQTLRIADGVYDLSKNEPPAGRSVAMVYNQHDPAVNNQVTERVVERWNRRRSGSAETFTFTDLPNNHDIIDPDNPRARTEIVYPKLLELIHTS